jgi:hypothetical protein
MEPAEALREWHDFSVPSGTASEALIGLTVVAAPACYSNAEGEVADGRSVGNQS